MSNKENVENQNELAVKPIGKLVAKFAIPSVISLTVTALYNIVDQIFIGNKIGYLGNGATNVVFPITALAHGLAMLLGCGCAAYMNLNMGKGKNKEADKGVGNTIVSLILLAVILPLLCEIFISPLLNIFGATTANKPLAIEYGRIIIAGFPFVIMYSGLNQIIRSDGNPKMAMFSMLSGAIINVGLDAWFMYGLEWGIKGAAWATVIGQVASGVLVIVYFCKFRKMYLSGEMLKPKLSYLGAIISLGLASCINQIAMAIVQIVLNNILRYYGANSVYGSDIPIACVGVISKVNQVFMAICIGISQGSQPIWGFNYGAKKYDRVRQAYRYSVTACTVIATIFFFCFQIFPHQIVGIFGTGSELYFQFSERYFRIYMFLTLINGIQPVTSNFFNSIGKSQLGVFMSLTRQILFLLPLIMIFPLFMGIDGVMYAGPIADAAAAIVCGYFMVRELKELSAMDRKKKEEYAA